MKALKLIGILLLVIVGIGLIASLVLPKDMDVSESITIDAPIDLVWGNVTSWEKRDRWSPWYKDDPDMKVSFEGEPGTLASKMSWEGNKDVGSGEQVFKEIDEKNYTVKSEVIIKAPWEGKGDVTVSLAEEGEGKTKVTWTFHSHSGIPGNLFSALFNAEAMLSEAYGLGLASLKEIAEEEFKTTPAKPAYNIRTESRPASKYAGKKELIKWDSMHNYFELNMPKLAAAVTAAKLEMTGAPSAMYWSWNEETKDAEMSVAIPIKAENAKAPLGYSLYDMAAGDVLVIDYYGDYDHIGDAHMAMETYMEENKLEATGVVLEEYVTDPGKEPDTSKWLTRVVYPYKKKAE